MSTSLDLPNNHGSFSSALPAPSHMPVQEYADKLLKFVERQNDPATAQVLFPVRALHHMKNRSVSEHEYLAVEFSVKDATVTMERKGDKEPGDKEKDGRAGGRVPKTWYMVFERTLSSPNNPKAALRSISGNEQYPQDIQDILNVIKEKASIAAPKTLLRVSSGTTIPISALKHGLPATMDKSPVPHVLKPELVVDTWRRSFQRFTLRDMKTRPSLFVSRELVFRVPISFPKT
ncbi:hypothetical protein BXZ70DRAFT_907525 [Cristinia sonorae]|uniref:Uncharacterized protein n=1 Tax=Cristinia sonorae TaxID=1940300 RepID=A0A8K0XPT7_9AGAR|nr:hypothetical protein BXZ70DRAFT_907525 [Cristinia sonorae]